MGAKTGSSSAETQEVEISRRILCFSKHHDDLSTLLGLHWPRIRVIVLLRKMAFVGRLLKSDDNQSSRVFDTLACDHIDLISLMDNANSWNQSVEHPTRSNVSTTLTRQMNSLLKQSKSWCRKTRTRYWI